PGGRTVMIRALAVWTGIAAVAVLNGAFREAVLRPRLTETVARAVSTVMLSAAILAITALAIGWITPAAHRDAWRIGAFWLALTVAFEFLAGHYLFGAPWHRIAADYNILQGRIWVLVLIVTLVAPAAVVAFSGRPS
ncbi:MAG TPA: hypothetical protein VFZ36_12825, partial [Vicinamibacterales bacterium]